MGRLIPPVLRKSLFFIDRSTKLQAIGLAIILVLTAFIEAVSIGVVFPLVEVLANPSALHDSAWSRFIFGDIEAGSEKNMIFLLAGIFLVAILFKNILLLASFIAQGWFFSKNEALLARRLFAHYLQGDYRRFLTRNSSDMMNHVIATSATVYSHAMRSLITIASESFLILLVATVLVITHPIMTLSALALLAGSSAIMYVIARGKIYRWGQRSVQIRQQALQLLQQGIHSIKEVRIFGCAPFVIDTFAKARLQVAKLDAKTFVMGNVPRLWIEVFVALGITLAIVSFYSVEEDTGQLLPTFALFGAAAFRLLPSFNRILMAFNSLRGGTFAVDQLYKDLSENEEPILTEEHDAVPLQFNSSIELENISFSYPGTSAAASTDITLTIKRGETVGLVGTSGAGKTTLADLLLGLLPPSSGQIKVDGKDISENLGRWQACLGYVPQTVYLIDDSLRRNIAFGISEEQIDEACVERALELAQLSDFVASLPDGLDTFVGDRGTRLSGGQRQRVGIARALYYEPKVLVLDEATSSLDNEAESLIDSSIKQLSGDKTIVIIAHRLSTLRSCDRLIFMENGRVVDIDTFEELAQTNLKFKKLVELSKLED